MATETGGRAGRRYRLQCEDSGERCSLVFSGEYEETLAEVAAHWRRAHGAHGDEADVREAAAALMREEEIGWLWPAEMRAPYERAPEPKPDWPF